MGLAFVMKTVRNYFILVLVVFISVNAFSDEKGFGEPLRPARNFLDEGKWDVDLAPTPAKRNAAG